MGFGGKKKLLSMKHFWYPVALNIVYFLLSFTSSKRRYFSLSLQWIFLWVKGKETKSNTKFGASRKYNVIWSKWDEILASQNSFKLENMKNSATKKISFIRKPTVYLSRFVSRESIYFWTLNTLNNDVSADIDIKTKKGDIWNFEY